MKLFAGIYIGTMHAPYKSCHFRCKYGHMFCKHMDGVTRLDGKDKTPLGFYKNFSVYNKEI